MEQHVRIIGIIDIVFGAIAIAAGVLLILGMGVIGAIGAGSATEDAALAGIVASLGLIGGLVIIGFGVFQIIVGVKLRQHESWARIAQIVLAVLSLFNFPIGTALGVYYLWAMLNKDTQALFQ